MTHREGFYQLSDDARIAMKSLHALLANEIQRARNERDYNRAETLAILRADIQHVTSTDRYMDRSANHNTGGD